MCIVVQTQTHILRNNRELEFDGLEPLPVGLAFIINLDFRNEGLHKLPFFLIVHGGIELIEVNQHLVDVVTRELFRFDCHFLGSGSNELIFHIFDFVMHLVEPVIKDGLALHVVLIIRVKGIDFIQQTRFYGIALAKLLFMGCNLLLNGGRTYLHAALFQLIAVGRKAAIPFSLAGSLDSALHDLHTDILTLDLSHSGENRAHQFSGVLGGINPVLHADQIDAKILHHLQGGQHLCRSLPVNGIVDFVLDFSEKLNGDFHFRVIINAGCVNFKHLTVKHLFGSTDVADALQQLLEVATAAQIFQAFVIQCEAFSHILLQNSRCPNAELHTTLGFHTIANGNDDIEIIVIHLIGFAVSGSCCKICNNCFSLQFALSENVFDMSGNGRFVSLKQFRHLINGKPNGISIEGSFDLCQAVRPQSEGQKKGAYGAFSRPYAPRRI